MDLWSVIPIGVHHYTILSTMVSSISLVNILWKDTTCKDLLWKWKLSSDFISSFNLTTSIYHTSMDILNFKTYAMQANIWNAHSNASIKFMSLLPLFVYSNFNWSPYFHISPPMSKLSPFVIFNLIFVQFLLLCHRWP